MRNTDSSGNTLLTTLLSSWALCRSWPNGFSITTRLQRPCCGRGQPRLLQLLAHHLEGLRRDRQIERVIAACAAVGVEFLQRLGESAERLLVVECALDEPDPLGQPVPHLLAVGCARVLPYRIADQFAEILVGPIPSGKADQGEVRRQQPAVGQVVDRRHQLLAGQIAGDSEDHHAARAGNPRHSLVPLVPQRITPGRRRGLFVNGGHFSAASS